MERWEGGKIGRREDEKMGRWEDGMMGRRDDGEERRWEGGMKGKEYGKVGEFGRWEYDFM